MLRNPDPKPGRWILPLVILGMVFFTWAFVQQLEPDVIADDQPISTTSTSTTTADGDAPTDGDDTPDESTTTTTLPEELAAYVSLVIGDQEELAALAERMDETNAGWDDRSIGYGDAQDQLIALAADSETFRDNVIIHLPPAGYGEVTSAHEQAVNAAEDIADAADAVLAGLRASDTGQARRSALLDFRSAVEAFNQAADAAGDAARAA